MAVAACLDSAALQAAEALAAGAGAAVSRGDIVRTITSTTSYELEAHLGSGGFGEVWQCSVVTGSASEKRQQRAVKIVKTDDSNSVQDEVRRHRRAVELAGALYVPQFYESDDAVVIDRPSSPIHVIVMQLISGLAANLLSPPECPAAGEYLASVIMHDVLIALDRLHGHGIVHRDVKPANVLIERSTGDCYLCDFGVSLFLDDVAPGQEMDQVGTPLYMAPEMLKTIPPRYDQKVDVWSYGIMGYELELGRTPIQKNKDDMPTQGVIFSTIQTMASPEFPSNYTLRYQKLVESCLETRPAQRPSSAELMENLAPDVWPESRQFVMQCVGP